jgi:Holliday junction resolvase RusA-like endonuclease
MRSVTITIPGEVVPKQSVRATGIPYVEEKTGKLKVFMKFYQTKEIKEYEAHVANTAREYVGSDPEVPFKLLEGTLAISATLIFKVLESMPKHIKDQIATGGIVYKATEPDLTDNLLKGIFDGFKDVIYKNDGQIALLREVKKIYGLEAKAIITIEEIEQVTSALI